MLVYDTSVQKVFLVSGTIGHIYIIMEYLDLDLGVRESTDNVGVFLEVIPSPRGLTITSLAKSVCTSQENVLLNCT